MRVFNMMLAQARGGVESMAVYYHQALEASGYDVTSFGHPKGALAEGLPPASFRPLLARFDYDPLVALELLRQIRRQKPDVILTHGGRATGLSLLTAGGSRTVQVMHNQFFKSYSRSVRAGFCVSRSVLEAARKRYPELALYETTNFTHLVERPVKPAPKGVPVIGALGRLHEQKGFDILLSALAELKSKGVRFKVKIAGEGPERRALETMRRSLSLEEDVEFIGWVSPVTDFLEGLDLYVMSSRYEPFGLSLAEALAAGVPAIAAEIDGPEEILEGGRFGRLFPNRDVSALAKEMAAAIKDWPRTLKVARAAQEHALKAYSFEPGRIRLKTALEAVLLA